MSNNRISRRLTGLATVATLVFAVAALQCARADTSVTFNEIHYHPATNEALMEWVELYNQMAVDVDISGWALDGGVHYAFPSNTIVRGGGFLLVGASPDTLAGMGLANVLGPFTGRLSNSGEQLLLRNNSGRVVDQVTYGIDGDWPVAPNGSGFSLAKLDHDTASGPAKNWAVSDQAGGTPGWENFGAAPPDNRLLAVDASWRCDSSGTDLGTAWRGLGYADNAWATCTPFTNAPIAGLFNTGVGADGVALPGGTPDPHYVITAAAQGTVGAQATVIANHPAWLANDTASSWIGVLNPGTANVQPGGYSYQTTFSLAGYLLSTVQLNTTVAADNDVTNVFLNGVPTGIAFTGFAAFSAPFKLTNGFNSAINALEYRTLNESTSPNPHGFRALLSGTALALNTNSLLSAGPTTTYLRKTFLFSGDPAHTALKLNAVIADGAIVYLNGVEVFRWNLPAGSVDFATLALTNVAVPDYLGQVTIPASSLVAGTNLLAVEVHQAAGSPDGPLFGADLVAAAVPVTLAARPSLAFNELSPATNTLFWLELANYSATNLALDGFILALEGSTNLAYVFPDGSSLPAGGFAALTNTTLGFHPAAGDRLFLFSPARDRILDAVAVSDGTRARYPNGVGPWLNPTVLTPGASNIVSLHNEIVINEIMYHHQFLPVTNGLAPESSNEAWLELFNRSTNVIDLTGWGLQGSVSFLFPAGKTIAPGGYLVVAKDSAALRALYPASDILGDFSGKLSPDGSPVILADPAGNPANTVAFFNDGRWPLYADGRGSSLELRDPYADNSSAQAWAASDETAKSAWQTYRYRAVAQTVIGPQQWNDFDFGLLGDGECLVDDISVVQSPTNNPIQFISNGDFENGLTGWRVLGNHDHSRVETDPANPANHVLHLIATGPQEHMHNHVETTLANGRSVTNGQLYEISFRAKWLAGNNFLNTRLYFDRVAATTVLPAPELNGTPGARNSCYATNIGPTFSQFQHRAVVPQPGVPVTVSVIAQDPQGVSACEVWWSTNGGAFTHASMALQTGGNYAGTIPGYPAGTIVQFYTLAVDGLGAVATYPAAGTNAGALYMVADGQAQLNRGHNLRIILTPANRALLHATTNVMSNENLPCTVIYDEQRAYYDMGVRLKSSERGRADDARVSFHIEFQPDDLFRGVHPVMLIDRSGASPIAANHQEEIVIRHMLLRAGGIPGTQPDMCYVIAPYSIHTSSAILAPRHEDEFIATAYDNGSSGVEWEMELIYYPTTTNQFGYKLPQPDNVIGVDISDLGNDKEIYRYDWIIKNHRDADDYSGLIPFAKTFSLPSGPALDAQTKWVMDVDEWLRAFALVSLCGVVDSYTFGNDHNLLLYQRPADGKMLAFPWDMDYAPTRSVTASLIGDQNWGKIQNLPGNKRRLYAHALDLINTSYNTGYMAYWVAHYASFAPGQDYSGFLTYIQQRTVAVLSEISGAGGNSPFAITATNLTTANNLVTLSGTAPVQVQSITINGVQYPLVWTSVSGWTVTVPVSSPTNLFNVAGFDLYGNALTNCAGTVTVRYTGLAPSPLGAVVLNEIMYNPAIPNAAYVELFNASTTASFDLSNWRVNGLGYTFPPGSIITNRQFLVLAKNRSAFISAYGTGAIVFDEFTGSLQTDGETLTLFMPGTESGQEITVDKVRYAAAAPWPRTDPGVSLQLIDPAQDNCRAGNWAVGQINPAVNPQWIYFSTNGTATSSTLYIFLQSAGDIYVDDVKLVAGSVPDTGSNLVSNAGFESSLSGTWTPTANFTQSAISTAVKHSGNSSLHVVATAAGSGNGNAIYQIISPSLVTGQPYALSFYYLQSTNGGPLTVRLSGSGISSGGINPSQSNVATVLCTPAAANSVGATLPAFPPLWLNELEGQNLTGITNRAGLRAPWLELYNASTNSVSLSGLYLANSYSNLTGWAFPANATIGPGQFKVIFADGRTDLSTTNELHTSFSLPPASGSLALSRLYNGQPQVLDYLDYANLTPNRSYGSFPDGQCFTRQEFSYVTPGATNNGASAPLAVCINEWMAGNTHTLANPVSGKYSDWFELYNYGTNSADLTGYYLTDNLTNRSNFEIPSGYTISPHGFLLVWADGKTTNGTADLHVSFKLDKAGESIGLYGADGNPVDYVSYGPQTDDVSQGRYPDGDRSVIWTMPSPTPGAANQIPNTAPVVAQISNQFIHAGQTLRLSATATDAESAFQQLVFTLDSGAPIGANIDSVTGLFTWAATNAVVPSTNAVTVRATDNGSPPLSGSASFSVIVLPLPQLASQLAGSVLHLSFQGLPGRSYQVQFKDNLSDTAWTALTSFLPGTGALLEADDDLASRGQRFYRIIVGP